MRRPALIAALLLALPLSAHAKRPGLAVMDVKSVQGVKAGTATLITDILVTEVSGARKYDVIGSSDITNLLGLERQKQMLQCTEGSSCLAELGGALGVDYLLSGTVGLLGTRLRISLTVQNVKKARVVARQARFCDANEDALARATEEAVRSILSDLDASVAAVAAATPPPPPVVAKEPAKRPPDLKPPPPKDATAEPLAPPPPEKPARTGPLLSRRGWAFVAGGAGLALLAAGGTFDGLAYAAYQDQKDAVAANDKAAYDSALSSGRTRATVANVLYGAGLAAVGTGAWLYFTGPSKTQITVAPTDGGAMLSLGGVLP